MAIFYSNLPADRCLPASIIFALVSAIILFRVRPFRRGIVVFLILFAGLIAWWRAIPPTNTREWQPNMAVLPYANINQNIITLHNIRNLDYRSEKDYTVQHYDKTVDLNKLQTVDFYMVYWGSPLIAHTMMSFGFEDGTYVCFSIETRKEKGEDYSAVKGFFKQYELTYVMADERDVVRLRTNYLKEDVHLYRLKMTPDTARLVFLDYIKSMNELKEKPEWYNALLSNCTTNIRKHTAHFNPNAKLDWRLFVNGHLNEFVYEQGFLDQSLTAQELKKRSHVNQRAQAADKDPEFSKRIREGLPGL